MLCSEHNILCSVFICRGAVKVMILIKIIGREFGIKHHAERYVAPPRPTVLS